MSQQRDSRESGSPSPTEQSVTPSTYHDETMAMTEQKTNQVSDAVVCRCVSTEPAILRYRSGLALMTKATS